MRYESDKRDWRVGAGEVIPREEEGAIAPTESLGDPIAREIRNQGNKQRAEDIQLIKTSIWGDRWRRSLLRRKRITFDAASRYQ